MNDPFFWIYLDTDRSAKWVRDQGAGSRHSSSGRLVPSMTWSCWKFKPSQSSTFGFWLICRNVWGSKKELLLLTHGWSSETPGSQEFSQNWISWISTAVFSTSDREPFLYRFAVTTAENDVGRSQTSAPMAPRDGGRGWKATLPRPSFGTEKGVPFYFCSIWFFLLGSGGPKKNARYVLYQWRSRIWRVPLVAILMMAERNTISTIY